MSPRGFALILAAFNVNLAPLARKKLLLPLLPFAILGTCRVGRRKRRSYLPGRCVVADLANRER
jgi:hypothetical protein